MNGFWKRDVSLVIGKVAEAIHTADNLNKLQPDRSLSVAITHLQTAELWLRDLEGKTPERA